DQAWIARMATAHMRMPNSLNGSLPAGLASRHVRRCFRAACLAACLTISACRAENDFLHYLGPGHPAEYIAHATEITYPDLEAPPDPINFAGVPRTVRQLENEVLWDLSLSECIQIALA